MTAFKSHSGTAIAFYDSTGGDDFLKARDVIAVADADTQFGPSYIQITCIYSMKLNDYLTEYDNHFDFQTSVREQLGLEMLTENDDREITVFEYRRTNPNEFELTKK